MSRFTVTDLPLPGARLIERQRMGDARGFLSRLFCAEELAPAGWVKPIAQINHTYTAKRGTIRGLHFQYAPHAEMKLVNCLRGEIWDVAVDLRPASPTFLKWHAEILSADNGRAFLIPEGFAHGFQALTDDCEILYLTSAPYAPGAEGGVGFDEPAVGVAWPIVPTEISPRDRGHPRIDTTFRGVPL